MILLVNPPVSSKAPFPNKCSLGLFFIKSFLKKHKISTIIIDEDSIEKTVTQIKKNIKNIKLLGFTGLSYQINSAIKISKLIKKEYPDIKIIFGGPAATGLSQTLIKEDSIDFIIKGEGEKALLKLLNNLNITNYNLEQIPSLTYKKEGNIFSNNIIDLLDPEEIILPEIDDLQKKGIVFDHTFRKKSALVMFSRGCLGNCSFCMSKKIFPGKVRVISPEKSFRYIKNIKEKTGINHFIIDDDNFLADKKFAMEFARLIRPLNVKFRINMMFLSFDKKVLLELKKSGLKKISIGIESIFDNTLKIINKKFEPDQLKKIIDFGKEYNILISLLFIALLPYDTEKRFLKTLDFINDLNPNGGFDFQILQPHPGTFDNFDLKNHGRILSKDYDEYFSDNIIYIPENISVESYRKLIEEKLNRAFTITGETEISDLERYKNIKDVIHISPEKFSADFNIENYHWKGSENCMSGLSIIKCRDYGTLQYKFSSKNNKISSYILVFRGASHPIGFPEGEEFSSDVIISLNDKIIFEGKFPSIHTIGKKFKIIIKDSILKNKNNILTFKIKKDSKHKNGLSIFSYALNPFFKKYETDILLVPFSDN